MVRTGTLTAIMILTVSSLLSAAVVNVPVDFSTIQEALDSWLVIDGDTILVQPGVYQENVDFKGRSIFLASLFLVTDDRYYIGSTVIDGGGSGSVVSFADDRKSRAAICGFTIRNGTAENGGGINCSDSKPRICQNIIRDNLARRQGGGIFCLRSDPEISGNIIMDNQAEQAGGICYRDLNLMRGNICREGRDGDFVTSPSFDEDKIAHLRYNILVGNSAHRGGAIYGINSKLSLENNTITENFADVGSGLLCEASDVEITSSIIWSNLPAEDPQILGDSLVVGYSDIQGGWPGDGNIDFDPRFSQPQYHDFKLMSMACGDEFDSPCIDAGSPEFTDDLVDCSRGRGTALCDMGAHGGGGPEYTSERLLRVPYDFDTPQQAIDASTDGDTVLVYPGVYPGNISLDDRAITLASLHILNPVPELVSATVFDGQSDGPVVAFENGESNSAVLAGLTLRNGLAVNGGGIHCHYSDPVIVNNIIESNVALSDGGGIFCFYSNPVIENNVFSSNFAVSGAGLLCRYSSPVIRSNRFNGNQAQQEGGGILVRDNSLPIINSNIIEENSAGRGGGIAFRYTAPSISGNIVHSNESTLGGGIYCVGSDPSLVNDIIAGNFAETGGALFCLNSAPTIVNCIFYFNDTGDGSQISGGQPSVSYSDIEGGWDGAGNIDSDPLFRDIEADDFHLSSPFCGDQTDSPCIDAGHPDISDSLLACEWGLGGARSDMGAYGGGYAPTGVDPPSENTTYSFGIIGSYPNPFNSSTTIRCRMPHDGSAKIEIYDICGRLVDILKADFAFPGEEGVVWEGGDLAAGVYFARLGQSRKARSIKLFLVK
jgi:parallel beta-helix repeat protein